MRIGKNPQKDNKDLVLKNYHRIIIPVFIPNFEGYFKDSLAIFKMCIKSILLTSHDKTRITIYNNDSHEIIKKYIDNLYLEEEKIDQVFHSKENLGKINAILAAAKGNLEPLITISDADVLFKNNWQENVEQVFLNFNHAGMVSPVPSSKAFKNFVDANWYYGIFRAKLLFKDVEDPDGLLKFDKSLGNDKPLYKSVHIEKYMVLQSKGNEAVMGCGHFVATLRREVFDKGTNEPAFIKIVGGVENKFIDLPNQELGFLRLATKKNYAYHLGNVKENWMDDEMNKLKKTNAIGLSYSVFSKQKSINKFKLKMGFIICKMLLHPVFKRKYFQRIGLSTIQAKEY
jgi:hypothetical protein